MKCLISRRAQFSASYRYWLPELSEAENLHRFGAESRFPGGGHNYVLSVSALGEIDKYGMVQNFFEVKQLIQRKIIDDLNYAYLNEIWPEFQDTLPTPEYLAKVIWQRLLPELPLAKVCLFEQPEFWVNYRGNGMEAFVNFGVYFSAAHRLALPTLSDEENRQIYGKCANANGHGHNYYLEVRVVGEIDSRTGRIVELRKLRQVIEEKVIEPLDHTFLNQDIAYFSQVIPTAENIALYLCNILQQPIRELGIELDRIELKETANNSCQINCRTNTYQENKTTAQETALLCK
ncbi:MAG: 6-carboxytetrahydropterin synthase [Spirulinaceae cyanobacterium]